MLAMHQEPPLAAGAQPGEGHSAIEHRLGDAQKVGRWQVQEVKAAGPQVIGIVASLRSKVDHRPETVFARQARRIGQREGAADGQVGEDPAELR